MKYVSMNSSVNSVKFVKNHFTVKYLFDGSFFQLFGGDFCVAI